MIQVNSIPSNIASHTRAEKRGNTQYDSPHMAKGLGRSCSREAGGRRQAGVGLGGSWLYHSSLWELGKWQVLVQNGGKVAECIPRLINRTMTYLRDCRTGQFQICASRETMQARQEKPANSISWKARSAGREQICPSSRAFIEIAIRYEVLSCPPSTLCQAACSGKTFFWHRRAFRG